MSEVNLDENAIAAVKAFYWWLGSDDNCGLEIDEALDKFIREVEKRKAVKTVEDAVEAFPDGWENPEYDCIAYNPSSNTFEYYVHTFEINRNWYHVCTRAEFEACAAKKVEKWTHVTSLGKCRVLIDTPDEHGYVVIEGEGNGYSLVPPRSLKPIKPTISRKEYDMIAMYAATLKVDPAQFDQYMSYNYDSQLKD